MPFGTRPASGAISLRNCRDVVIENKTFRDLGPNVIAIRIENCSNVTIRAVDFINVSEGVYAVNSSKITVRDSRYRNITGPHQRVGLNRANFVQFNHVNGGLIDHNKGKEGDTEDIVSIFASQNIVVEDNHFEGTNWTSSSGSGIALGDVGGSGNIARRNVLLNPGQVGIFIAGGTNNQIVDNVIYQAQRPRSNVAIYVWKQPPNSTATCAGHTVRNNQVRWLSATGASSAFWDAGNCGAISTGGNSWSAPLDPSALRVSL